MQINLPANWKIEVFPLLNWLETPGKMCAQKTYDSNKQVNNFGSLSTVRYIFVSVVSFASLVCIQVLYLRFVYT